jgi:amino acid permease
VPLPAMLATAVAGLCVLLPLQLQQQNEQQWGDLFALCTHSACLVYLCMFVSFLVFRQRYAAMERPFRNPCGPASALFGIAYFSAVLVSQAMERPRSLLLWAAVQLLASLYYLRVASAQQLFSSDEQQRFMPAYVLKGTTAIILLI